MAESEIFCLSPSAAVDFTYAFVLCQIFLNEVVTKTAFFRVVGGSQ
jgi:hypothetical protein